MTRTLGSPATELAVFKQWILERIEQKIADYQTQNNPTKAMALQCRLDTHPKATHKKTWLKTKIFSASLGLFGLAAGLFWQIQTPEQKAVPTPIPITQKNNSDSAQSIETNPEQEISLKMDIASKEIVAAKAKTDEKAPDTQSINLIIWPFANVFVDGKQLASNTKNLVLTLSKGSHNLKLTHDYAATVEKKIEIDNITKPTEMRINLDKSKPAFLVINSNIEADVAVNGHYKGSSKSSTLNPMVIPIPDRKHGLESEVIIQRNGYQTQIHRVEFTAGKISHLSITLTALADTDSRRAQDVP